MASHTVTFRASSFYEPEMNQTFKTTSVSPTTLDVSPGDTVTFKYLAGPGGPSNLTMTGFSATIFSPSGNQSLYSNQTSVRTVLASGSNTIFASWAASGFNSRSCAITSTQSNAAPVASVVGDISVLLGNAVNLDAGTSTDPDGDTVTYAFAARKNGTTIFSRSPSAEQTWSFTPNSTGIWVTEVTVLDPSYASDKATLTTTVANADSGNGSETGYGMEIRDAFGNTQLTHNTMMIRKVGAVTVNSSGSGSTVVGNVDSLTRFVVSASGGASVKFTVTGSGSTRTISITGGDPSAKYTISAVR